MSAVCPSCGQPTTPGAVFCDNCGHNLAAAMPPSASPAPVAGMTPCPACGFGNVTGAMFCENCGSALAAPAPQPAYVPPPPPPPQDLGAPPPPPPPVAQPVPMQPQMPLTISGTFVVVATGVAIPIPPGKTEVLVGREDPVSGNFPDVDLDPHDGLNQGVSRQHCKLSLQNGQLMVEDMNAVNKTHLHGQQLLPGQKVPLNNGDELVLGRLRLIYNS